MKVAVIFGLSEKHKKSSGHIVTLIIVTPRGNFVKGENPSKRKRLPG